MPLARFHLDRSFTRVLLGAVALLIALAAAGQAKAACGYYVVAQNPSESMAANINAMRAHASAPADQECPCNGPNCRAHDSNTPFVPSAAPTGADQHFADLPADTSLTQQSFRSLIPVLLAAAPSVYPSSIDPPPRDR
jgi:hypothetical protein